MRLPSRTVCGLIALLFAAQPALAAMEHGHAAPANETDTCADPAQPASLRCARGTSGAFDALGRLWLAWAQGGHVYVQRSDDRGVTYTDPVAVNTVPEVIAADGENRPKIALGNDGAIYVSWTRSGKARFTGDVRFTRSEDSGSSFTEPVTVNDDHAPISHRFDAMSVAANGAIELVWIDKRDMAAAKARGEDYVGAALYHAVSRDGGRSFAANRKLVDNSCECCRIAIARDRDDRAVVLWRQVFPGQIRDHALLKLDATGARGPLHRASLDDWQINACPHHGPAIAIDSAGTYHIAWYTGRDGRMGLYYANSTNQGTQFTTARRIGAAERAAESAHPQVLAQGNTLYLAWRQPANGKTAIFVQHSTDAGTTWSTPTVIADTTGRADHPHLLSDGRDVYLSWQTQVEGYRLVPVINGSQ